MSTIDAYEAQRGPVRRRKNARPGKKRVRREIQLRMQLYGGGSPEQVAKDRPFNDEIPF